MSDTLLPCHHDPLAIHPDRDCTCGKARTAQESDRLESVRQFDDIRTQARKELAAENFRAAVDAEKARLRKAKWWHKLLPFVIRIEGRKS